MARAFRGTSLGIDLGSRSVLRHRNRRIGATAGQPARELPLPCAGSSPGVHAPPAAQAFVDREVGRAARLRLAAGPIGRKTRVTERQFEPSHTDGYLTRRADGGARACRSGFQRGTSLGLGPRSGEPARLPRYVRPRDLLVAVMHPVRRAGAREVKLLEAMDPGIPLRPSMRCLNTYTHEH